MAASLKSWAAAWRSLSRGELLLLVAAVLYAVLRTGRSIWLLAQPKYDVCDLKLVYTTWLLWRDGQAHAAAAEVTYLPFTYLFFTPLFSLGWPVTRLLSYFINGAAIVFILQRLAAWVQLPGKERLFLYAFFFCWLPTGLVLGLGNLALLSFAGAVAAFPVHSRFQTAAGLMLAAVKHSLTAPVFLLVFLRRPRVALTAGLILLGIIAVILLRTGVTLPELLAGIKAGGQIMGAWEIENETVSLPVHFTGLAKIIVPPVVFLVLFAWSLRWRDTLKTFAAVMIVTLLPVHHRRYDLIVLAPVLAIMLRQLPLLWPAIFTACLIGVMDSFKLQFTHFYKPLLDDYYLCLLLGTYALLAWLDRTRPPLVVQPPAPAFAFVGRKAAPAPDPAP